jgi:carbon-monoxide dehydrogenase large subunit
VLADACELVDVDYHPLPAVTDPDAALAEGTTLLCEELGSIQLYAVPVTPGPAMDAAPRRASLRLVNQRTAAAPLEVLGCVADWRDDGLTAWATTQTPHVLRSHLAGLLHMPQGRLRVIAPDVGSGFGAKNAVYPEYLVAPVLSRLLARPVRSTQSRRGSLVHMNHGRDQIHEVEIGFDDHGRILALSVVLTQNLGAYSDAIGMTLVGTAMLMGVGCYALPSYQAGIRLVLTNTPPVSAYRGAGRPEASYTIERVVDHVAVATGMDPADVRRRNFIAPAAFPYATPAGLVYDSGDYAAALDLLLSAVGYAALRAEQRRPPSHRGRPALARDRPGHVHRHGGRRAVGPDGAALSGRVVAHAWVNGRVRRSVGRRRPAAVRCSAGGSPGSGRAGRPCTWRRAGSASRDGPRSTARAEPRLRPWLRRGRAGDPPGPGVGGRVPAARADRPAR